ncbi:MAG: PAS domain S-box protein [Ectothiorhodospiraceae bacterium]|nr:PAS domain S-box protein [Ectothiorhodospiraceae bacterium]
MTLLLGSAAAVCCLLLAVALWQQARWSNQHHFLGQQQTAFQAVVDALEDSTALARRLGRIMGATGSSDARLFDVLASEYQARDPHLELVAWIEPEPERSVSPFRLSQLRTRSDPLDQRAAQALLIDTHANVLQHAIASEGLTTVDGPVLLPASNGVSTGQLLFQPAFDGSGILRGVVVIALRFDALAHALTDPADASLHLFETRPGNGRELPLYSSPRQSGTAGATPTTDSLKNLPHLHETVHVADRTWSAWLVPARPLPMPWSAATWLPLTVLAGLLLGLTVLAHNNSRARRTLSHRYAAREHLLGELRETRKQLEDENQRLQDDLRRTRAQARQDAARAQEQAQRSRQLGADAWLFRHAFDNAAMGMAMFDPGTGACLRANQAFCDMLGYSGGELAGLDFREITHPADIHITPPLVRTALRGGKDRFTAEKRYLHRNGRIVWCHIAGTLLRTPGGEPLQLAVQAYDISRLRTGQAAPAEPHAIVTPH